MTQSITETQAIFGFREVVFIVYPLYWIASQCTGVACIVFTYCVLLFNCLSSVIKSILVAAESTSFVIAYFGDEEGAKVL